MRVKVMVVHAGSVVRLVMYQRNAHAIYMSYSISNSQSMHRTSPNPTLPLHRLRANLPLLRFPRKR